MNITGGAFSDMFKANNIWKDFDKFFNSSDYTDIMAYNQLTAAQNQAVQQYTNQYNMGTLGQLYQGAQAYNGLGVLSGNNQGSTLDDYIKKCEAAKTKSLMPSPKLNKKAENEVWLDSKIAEVSFVL